MKQPSISGLNIQKMFQFSSNIIYTSNQIEKMRKQDQNSLSPYAETVPVRQFDPPFKLDLPGITKNKNNHLQENSWLADDGTGNISSERLQSLIRLIKKSKSSTKILKNSPYCTLPYKNQLLNYIQEKEQYSLCTRRSPPSRSLTRSQPRLAFIIVFTSAKPKSSKVMDRYILDAEPCRDGLNVTTQKIKEQLEAKLESIEHKHLFKKIIGFSCNVINRDQNLGNRTQTREKEHQESKLEETISYLLSISLLNLEAQEFKTIKTVQFRPIFASSINNLSTRRAKKIMINDFEFVKCLGSGGFSTVYMAKGLHNNRYYALKLIDKQFIIETERQAIVSNERYILEKILSPEKKEDPKDVTLRHQFVTKLEYAFETYHHFIFVMEFCPGGQLFHQLKKVKKMTEDQAKFYFLQILIGLDHIHSHGVVYRDLKPENLLIDAQGHIKIADFGLSKPVNTPKQMSYSFCGSPEYMAPQMLCKSGHNYLLDYYCLGALLYELVVGIPPYYSLNQEQIYHSIMNQNLTFPSKTHLSPEIKSLLEGLLNKDMKKRLGSLCGIKEILFHPWIGKINKAQIENRKLTPPFLPNLMKANFDVEDIKSDLGKIDRKLNEDALVGSKFQTHFTDQFYYQQNVPLPNKSQRQCIKFKNKLIFSKTSSLHEDQKSKSVEEQKKLIPKNKKPIKEKFFNSSAPSKRFVSQLSMDRRFKYRNSPLKTLCLKSVAKTNKFQQKLGNPILIEQLRQKRLNIGDKKHRGSRSNRKGENSRGGLRQSSKRTKQMERQWLQMMKKNSMETLGYSNNRQTDKVGQRKVKNLRW